MEEHTVVTQSHPSRSIHLLLRRPQHQDDEVVQILVPQVVLFHSVLARPTHIDK